MTGVQTCALPICFPVTILAVLMFSMRRQVKFFLCLFKYPVVNVFFVVIKSPANGLFVLLVRMSFPKVSLFLTLTYNNENLPKHGVFKEEIQLFLKRLRISLDRLHYKHNLRYFACAEYGSTSKRPHYHMYFDVQAFFVPLRLVWDNLQKFMGEQLNPGDSIDYLVPQATETAVVSSLSHYMGIPSGVALTRSNLFHRAYNFVWNELVS